MPLSMIRSSLVLALLAALAGTASAQQRGAAPECRLNYRSNFRLNGAQQHLATAERASHVTDKLRRANDALRVLGEAARAGGVDQLTLWFFMGQAQAITGDLAGADTSWTRAEALADENCKVELARRRRNEFIPFNNAAVQAIQDQQGDSAIRAFQNGLKIYRGDPAVYITIGTLYLQQEREDSAVAYFRKGALSSNEPRTLAIRSTALFNAARLLQRARRWEQADTVYREYIRIQPNDAEARAGLANVLNSMGRRAEATAMYDSMLASADSLTSFDLFDIGVALFRQAQGDTAAADSTRQHEMYHKAARAFELGLGKNPNLRDALYNLTNTYLALNDTALALNAARRLVATDPLSSSALRLLAAGYQRYAMGYGAAMRAAAAARDTATVMRLRPVVTAYQDSTVATLSRGDSIPVELQVTRFDPADTTATLRGAVSNRQSTEQPGFTLTFEFLNGAGEVVATQAVEVPTLNPLGGAGGLYDFSVTANGRGIIAYRYRRS